MPADSENWISPVYLIHHFKQANLNLRGRKCVTLCRHLQSIQTVQKAKQGLNCKNDYCGRSAVRLQPHLIKSPYILNESCEKFSRWSLHLLKACWELWIGPTEACNNEPDAAQSSGNRQRGRWRGESKRKEKPLLFHWHGFHIERHSAGSDL